MIHFLSLCWCFKLPWNFLHFYDDPPLLENSSAFHLNLTLTLFRSSSLNGHHFWDDHSKSRPDYKKKWKCWSCIRCCVWSSSISNLECAKMIMMFLAWRTDLERGSKAEHICSSRRADHQLETPMRLQKIAVKTSPFTANFLWNSENWKSCTFIIEKYENP